MPLRPKATRLNETAVVSLGFTTFCFGPYVSPAAPAPPRRKQQLCIFGPTQATVRRLDWSSSHGLSSCFWYLHQPTSRLPAWPTALVQSRKISAIPLRRVRLRRVRPPSTTRGCVSQRGELDRQRDHPVGVGFGRCWNSYSVEEWPKLVADCDDSWWFAGRIGHNSPGGVLYSERSGGCITMTPPLIFKSSPWPPCDARGACLARIFRDCRNEAA